MQPLVLCAAMDQNRLMRLSFAAMALGIRVKAVPDSQAGQTLAALCGLEPENPRPPKAQIAEEMMVMAFFDDALLDRFLKALRDGHQSVGLKAVLTPYNRRWTCAQLYCQLRQEAAQLGK